MTEDSLLLRRFAESRDEAAFALLVERHLGLVHSAALRQLNGDQHLARDVAQIVFTDLARKAQSLDSGAPLAGWLFLATRFAATKMVRTEQRRRAREETAGTMNEMNSESENQAVWEPLRPLLDETLAKLGDKDRLAVLLRYFEGRSYAEIGEALSTSENSARMRTDRALQKLHTLLTRRGMASSATALSMALAGNAVLAAPAGLATSVTSAALSTTVTATGLGGLALLMGMTKAQVTILGAVLATGLGGLAWQHTENSRLSKQLEQAQHRASTPPPAQPTQASATNRTEAQTRTEQELHGLRQEATQLQQQLSNQARVPASPNRPNWQGTVYPLSQLDVKPKALFQSAPQYPNLERIAGMTGQVVIEFIVQPDGEVGELSALKSTRKSFEDSAIAAVQKWKFEPGQKGGLAVGTRMQVPIIFNITDDSAEPPHWF